MIVDLPTSTAGWHRRVWSLGWPVILANLTIPLVGVVDTAVMGRLPDPAYIGAVAVGAAIFNALYWIFGFLRMGTTGLAAQASGARDRDELLAVMLRGLIMAAAAGLLLIVLQSPLRSFAFWVFPASEPVERLAGGYFDLRIWGAPALLAYLVVLGTLFGQQRMTAALLVSLLLNVCNLVLDVLFVVGFGWGVRGVAVGTALSEWLAAAVGVVMALRGLRAPGGPLARPPRLLQRERLTALFHVSANLIVRSFFVQLPFFVFTALAAGFGDRVLAANAVLMQLFFVMTYGLDGLAHTAETLAGHAFGARDRAQLRNAMRYTLLWSVLLAVAVSLVYAIAGPLAIDRLTLLPEVRETARTYLYWVVLSPLVAVWAFQLDGVFIGTTRTVELRNSMFAAALAFLLTLWLCLDRFGNHGLWFAMMVFMGVRSVLLGLQYPRLEVLAAAPAVRGSRPSGS